MLEQIAAHPNWFWLSLGGLLLSAEMLGASGYLLWSGIAAVVVGILVWLLPPLSWAWQGGSFAVLTLMAAFLWWYWLNKHTTPRFPQLNVRSQQLIGLRMTLMEPTQDGFGRIKIGDSSWRVYSATELPTGTEIEVVSIEGITLKIRPVSQ